MQSITTRLIVSVLIVLSASSATGLEITVPNVATSQNAFPFGYLTTYTSDPPRYQQAYSSILFGDAPIIVKELSFFLESSGSIRSGTYIFSFSTIQEDIDSLSDTDYGANVGSDEQFFASVDLGGSAPSVLTIDGNPFLYDPAQGSLLLDVRVQNAGNLAGFPAHFRATVDSLGQVTRYTNMGFPVQAWYGWGLQTRFTIIPEPTTSGLMLLGILFLCGRRPDSHQY